MANRAYAVSTGVGYGTYTLLDETDAVVTTNNMSVSVSHSDSSRRVLMKLADNIRSTNSDPTIRVVFIGVDGTW